MKIEKETLKYEAYGFLVYTKHFRFQVIYGNHEDKWFIAVPNWRISVEAAHPCEIFYNTDKLMTVFGDYENAKAIAEAVNKHWSKK